MAKVSTNPITSFEQDWGNDVETGLPYSGKAVQDFIKGELGKRPESEAVTKSIESAIKDNVFQGEDGTIVTDITKQGVGIVVTTMNASGTSTSVPMDFSKEDPNARAIQVAVQVDRQAINVGGAVAGSFGFLIRQGQKILSGEGANVQLRITRVGSSTPLYTASLGYKEASETEENILSAEIPDLTSILASRVTGNATVNVAISVAHTYTYVDDSGEEVTRTINGTGTTRITIISLTLNADRVNIVNQGQPGQVLIPYTVEGNGTKAVYLYRNGVLEDTHSGIEDYRRSSNFTVNNLPNGVTNFQIVAQAASGDTVVTSSSHYFDLFGSATEPIIALKVEDTTGTIQGENEYKTPTFSTPKFADFKFGYYAYSIGEVNVPAKIVTEELTTDGIVVATSLQDQTLARRLYTYSKKVKTSNNLRITFTVGTTTRVINVAPMTSSINIELPTESLQLNLDADGRSNEEVNPAVWNYGDVTTEFSGLNWQSNGWVGNALLLQNGAKAKVNFPLFQAVNNYPVTRDGCTFEILFMCSNATLEEHDIISCHWMNNDNRKTGLNITTSYVGVDTGEVTEYRDDDGKVTQSVVTRVGSQYAQNNWYKYTFVIDPNAPGVGSNQGLCYGYLNGILSYIAPIPSSFINLDKLPIIIDSTYADVYVKSIKYYNEPLTHDQCVDEHIIDQETAADIETLYNKNAVLSKDNNDKDYVSPQKLRAMGRGVMIISPSASQTQRTTLQDLNKSSDKKSYYGPFRVAYFAPATDLNLGYTTVPLKGNSFNFLHTECAIRIQGTTSTKRPRKNYRLHFNKKDGSSKPAKGSFIVGGEVNDSFKYAMSQGAVKVPIACLKVDYVDSSMTHNTGGGVVFNEMTRNVASLRNPAQAREYVSSPTDIKTRVAVEGFPIDVFAADSVVNPDYTDTLDDNNYRGLVYMGQYNYNNDKSKSGAVFGFDGSYTYDADGNYDENGAYQPICVEFLDNNADLDLFKVKFTSGGNIDEAATYAGFADALEVRAPEDVTDHVAKFGLDSLATSNDLLDDKGNVIGENTYKYVPGQLKRVFSFIGECAKQVAQNNGISVASLNTLDSDGLEALDWSSTKFTTEVNDYFNLASVCAWYIWTDYLIAVDQRAKNMMMYTMDGKHWMFQYYDGDTMLGERNDCFLAYDYLTDRTTWDDAVKQYAMQGHDSWLWYLVRANFTDQKIIDGAPDAQTAVNLSSVCQLMRSSGKFSADYFKQILNGQFVNNWSQRQYNYSQDYKYVQPLTETGYPSDISTNFINTAQGSREAHRTYTLENRFALLDSKYQAGDYAQDAFVYYAAAGNVNKLTIVSSIPYYFGWNTSNTSIRQHQAANADNNYTVELEITGNAANNPANVLGASRIKELYFNPQSAWTVDATKNVKLPNLHKLVASGMGTRAVGDLYLTECPLLTYVDISSSNFSGLYGLENSSKLVYVDVEGTDVKSIRFADGSPLETIKLASPQGIYLSNIEKVVYQGGDTDTLTAQNWTQLSELLINNCPNIDWEKLVTKLIDSSAATKYLRITGINKEDNITWLDQFDGFYGLDSNGGQITTGAQLVGTLQLLDYTDDALVETYRAKYPTLTIKQPEYTLIEADETILDETSTTENSNGNITNLDNNTGARTSTKYVPSGHILNILNRCHRYLGKVTVPGNAVELAGNPNDSTAFGRSFQGRDDKGSMLLIQLADFDSQYFNTGYTSHLTRRQAPLDGLAGHGEVGVKVPGFWYKGINYVIPQRPTFSRRYTCYSSYEERPSKSDETKVITIDELNAQVAEDGNDNGLYRENRGLKYTQIADTVGARIDASANNAYNIYRINVEGFKKMRFPASIGDSVCSLFTDESGKIITSSTGSVIGVGEIYINSAAYTYNGMGVITTIPAGAKYFYMSLRKFITGSSTITSDPCDIVLHKGSLYDRGDDMNETNVREWIADMEPDWVYSEPVFIHATECAFDGVDGLYTPFDGLQTPAKGTASKENDLTIKGEWFQYSMRDAAFQRGLQLIDYEASKLIAMLFMARYGRRNSQNQLGGGTHTNARRLGTTRAYGMRDTVIPNGVTAPSGDVAYQNAAIALVSDGGATTYEYPGSPNFLGIEDVHGNVGEWLDRAYYANETPADCGKVRITMPDLSTRRVYSVTPANNYPRSVVHGKWCDIVSCASSNGSNATCYPDYQYADASLRNNWASTRAIRRSNYYADATGGVFYVSGYYSVSFSYTHNGSRLIFRGNMTETTDIDLFLNTEEWRG